MQKLAEICVRRPVFATMIILSLVVVGLFSYKSLGVDLFPKIDLPTITVTVINPGASPQEIETEITDKVEGTVNTISGIDELRSTSVEGASQVFITFLLEKNADVAAQEVRNKVDLIVNDLPVTAEKPIVQKLDTDATPVLRIAVSAPRSLKEVTDVADKQSNSGSNRSTEWATSRSSAAGNAKSRSGSTRTNCALTTSPSPRCRTP
jgi:HAE1 family hydrophobic/amphiphilic exporter-1